MFCRIGLVSILFLTALNLYSQECFEYQKSNCIPKPSKFVYQENNASVSFLFSSGEEREIPLTFMHGRDYRITLCADKVFDNIIKLVIKNEDGKVIYDNSTQNFNLNLEFTCRKTQDVTIDVAAPDVGTENNDTVLYEGCIGLLIEDMKSVKTGF